jgi:hypothetical protein
MQPLHLQSHTALKMAFLDELVGPGQPVVCCQLLLLRLQLWRACTHALGVAGRARPAPDVCLVHSGGSICGPWAAVVPTGLPCCH